MAQIGCDGGWVLQGGVRPVRRVHRGGQRDEGLLQDHAHNRRQGKSEIEEENNGHLRNYFYFFFSAKSMFFHLKC